MMMIVTARKKYINCFLELYKCIKYLKPADVHRTCTLPDNLVLTLSYVGGYKVLICVFVIILRSFLFFSLFRWVQMFDCVYNLCSLDYTLSASVYISIIRPSNLNARNTPFTDKFNFLGYKIVRILVNTF